MDCNCLSAISFGNDSPNLPAEANLHNFLVENKLKKKHFILILAAIQKVKF